MHAFVFWHRPEAAVDATAYETALTAFHAKLAAADCPGFLGSATFAIDAAPWLDGQPGYEDWSFVAGSWALDPLNRAAVSGAREDVHDAVAALSGVGHGGLYALQFGTETALPQSRVWWLTKPRGARHETPLRTMAASVDGRAACWRRQMVLGPAPEFALVTDGADEPRVPDGWSATAIARRLLWAGPLDRRDV